MSQPDLRRDRPAVPPSPTTDPASHPPDTPPSNSVPLGEAIKRGWDWVIFTWQMLQRLGGPLDILRTIWTVLSILITRLLVQLGIIKKQRR